MKGKLAFISLLLVLLLPSLVGCGVLSEFIEKTPSEIAVDTVEQYYQTHVYSEYDFFVCSDMALDVWDMLKAQGIPALIQIGNVETGAENITEADHAWVLAEVSPGHYLALETTAGYAVWEKDNPLYYQGWSFDNPREYKRFVELRQEYNIRAIMIEQLATKVQETYEAYEKEYDYYQELLSEYDRRYVGRPVSLKCLEAMEYRDKIDAQLDVTMEKEGRYNQLTELINEQKHELENIVSEMKGLAEVEPKAGVK